MFTMTVGMPTRHATHTHPLQQLSEHVVM